MIKALKEQLLDALLYLFEFYSREQEGKSTSALDFAISSKQANQHAGDLPKSIDRNTFLEQMGHDQILAHFFEKLESAHKTRAVRVFNTDERSKLSPQARGYILYLEHLGILSFTSREETIERAMGISESIVGAPDIKLICLQVLANRPDLLEKYFYLESLLLKDFHQMKH